MPYPRRAATVTLQPDWAVGLGTLVAGGSSAAGGGAASVVPTITSISPASGVTAGGTVFTLGGTNFIVSATTVSLGGTNASSVSVISGTTLTGTSPAGAAGTADIVVTTPNGSATSTAGWTFLNNFAITGSIRAGASAISNGRVILYDSSGNSYKTAVIDSSGDYAFSNVTGSGASYYLYPHLAYGHSLSSVENGWNDSNVTGQISVTVNSSDVSRNIACVAAFFADNFQGYADTTALKHATTGFGGTAKTTGGSRSVTEPTSPAFGTISLSADGPSGSKVMRYDFTDDNGVNCTGGTLCIQTNFALPSFGTCYIRFMDYLSSGFHLADYTCAETANYKQLLSWWRKTAGGNGEKGFFYDNGPATFRSWGILSDGATTLQNGAFQNGCVFPGGNPCNYDAAAWTGSWHVWVIELLNIGTSAEKCNMYLDGQKIWGLSGSQTGLNKTLDFVQWGANINSIPTQEQHRLFRECGIYFTRPALIDVVS